MLRVPRERRVEGNQRHSRYDDDDREGDPDGSHTHMHRGWLKLQQASWVSSRKRSCAVDPWQHPHAPHMLLSAASSDSLTMNSNRGTRISGCEACWSCNVSIEGGPNGVLQQQRQQRPGDRPRLRQPAGLPWNQVRRSPVVTCPGIDRCLRSCRAPPTSHGHQSAVYDIVCMQSPSSCIQDWRSWAIERNITVTVKAVEQLQPGIVSMRPYQLWLTIAIDATNYHSRYISQRSSSSSRIEAVISGTTTTRTAHATQRSRFTCRGLACTRSPCRC